MFPVSKSRIFATRIYIDSQTVESYTQWTLCRVLMGKFAQEVPVVSPPFSQKNVLL